MSERGLEIKRFGGFESLSVGIAMHIQQRPCCSGMPDFEKATKRTAQLGEISIATVAGTGIEHERKEGENAEAI
jgi:hypothetical protein